MGTMHTWLRTRRLRYGRMDSFVSPLRSASSPRSFSCAFDTPSTRLRHAFDTPSTKRSKR
ncbi:MAG: hypothetical protein WC483_07050 [Candidatus Paceibacterota bacterium]